MKKLVLAASFLISTFANAQDASTMTFDELKTKIVEIASLNTNRLDNFAEVREQLNPLVKELAERADQSVEERVDGKIGSWKRMTDDQRHTPNNFFIA